MPSPIGRRLAGVALVSAALLMTELALTRIFSVVMYYHFAFLAISIALFGVSASGVFAYLARRRLDRFDTDTMLAAESIVYAVATIVALFWLVRLRVGLNYSPHNLALMLTIYALAALPFFAGGLVVTLAISRFSSHVNAIYAADLIGAAGGCLILIPLLDRLGAPGVVLAAAVLSVAAGLLFAGDRARVRIAVAGAFVLALPIAGQLSGRAGFDIVDTKGHRGDTVLFSKWNAFSRIGVYARAHGDWSLSPAYKGPLPETRFMDIDSAASTPILGLAPDLSNAQYLRYELTALAYQLVGTRAPSSAPQSPGPQVPSGFTALVIGPGGGRDLASALVFGAARVDGVEINPIIADDVMRDRFRGFSGGIYANPRVRIAVDDGRSFVRRTPNRYDVIQASLVDTWAATAAGAYTLTENTLYTVEAFDDYLDHLNDEGILSITRWVADGLRLVSLAQAACEHRGWSAADRLAIVRQDSVATLLLKKSPFTAAEIASLRGIADRLAFDVAFGKSMLFGNGLSALLTLLGISTALVVLFVIGPLALVDRQHARPRGWLPWLVYFGALGAGFMLIEVSVLQRFVLLLGHPVYSLTVTLFSLLLGTGLGAAWSRRFPDKALAQAGIGAVLGVALIGVLVIAVTGPIIDWAIPLPRAARMLIAVAMLLPMGLALGMPMPTGLRLLSDRAPQMMPWAWGINGALSVLGATLAIFIAMNWGFRVTLLSASAVYLAAATALLVATEH
ncbi:MAG: hypothetical protein DMF93_03165 [Acidobacteria bacterium]|nr:MAG: hypothetical protein DMF93_03165 [Acidobacteriota bacterium]